MTEPRLIDTNILLAYFTSDDPAKHEAAARLLSRLQQNEEQGLLTPLVVFETIFTLQRVFRRPKQEVSVALLSIFALDAIIFEERELFANALDVYASTSLSFADAYHVIVMRLRGIREIYSYDRGFDRFADIARIEPA